MKSPKIFWGFIFYCYICIKKKQYQLTQQHYEKDNLHRPFSK